jgi:hypothetical protein
MKNSQEHLYLTEKFRLTGSVSDAEQSGGTSLPKPFISAQ